MARRSGGFPYSALLAFVAVVALAFVLIQIGGVGLSQAGTDEINAGNETVVVSYGTEIEVANATSRYFQGARDNETVYNQSGATLTEGTDYTWDADNGTVTFINTSATTAGNDATVNYVYFQNIQEVRQSEPVVRRVIAAFGSPFVYLPFITFVASLGVLALRWINSATGRSRGMRR